MDKYNDQNVIFFKNNNDQYHQDDDIPSLYLYKQKTNTELKALFYFNNGFLNRTNDKPAIDIKKDDNVSIKIWMKDGKLHRENNFPAIDINLYNLNIQAFFFDDYSYNTDNGALIITDQTDGLNNFVENFFIDKNLSNKGFNHFYKTGNIITLKESGSLEYKTLIEHLKKHLKDFIITPEETHLQSFFTEIGKIRNTIRELYYFDNNKSDIPSRIRITPNGKVDKLEWLIKNGLKHRHKNPAVINYEASNYSCKFYEHGKPKESLFTPYSISYTKKEHKKTRWFFHNKEIQQFYLNYDLNPFNINENNMNLININFKM